MKTVADNPRPIRVLVADDSAFMRTAITRMVESDSGLAVCGTAQTGLEALEKVTALDPDVITLDVEMPGLNGLETLKRIMASRPRPVIMVSSLTEQGDGKKAGTESPGETSPFDEPFDGGRLSVR